MIGNTTRALILTGGLLLAGGGETSAAELEPIPPIVAITDGMEADTSQENGLGIPLWVKIGGLAGAAALTVHGVTLWRATSRVNDSMATTAENIKRTNHAGEQAADQLAETASEIADLNSYLEDIIIANPKDLQE